MSATQNASCQMHKGAEGSYRPRMFVRGGTMRLNHPWVGARPPETLARDGRIRPALRPSRKWANRSAGSPKDTSILSSPKLPA